MRKGRVSSKWQLTPTNQRARSRSEGFLAVDGVLQWVRREEVSSRAEPLRNRCNRLDRR
jgi:hypothetical protein